MTLARHSATIAWRNLIKMSRTPEQLLDVTLQPALFLVIFTYIFGGAIAAGSQHEYLQFLLPGLLGQSIALGGVAIGVNLNSDLEKGIFDRFRSLPIARSAPLVGAVMADIVRYALLTACSSASAMRSASVRRPTCCRCWRRARWRSGSRSASAGSRCGSA